jgi:hypothetical protein
MSCSLSAPNFMVSTSRGKILSVAADSFNTPDPNNPAGCELLVEAPDSCLSHVLAHPLRPELLLLATPPSSTACASSSCSSGSPSSSKAQAGKQQGQKLVPTQRLLRWDLVSKSCLTSRQLPPEQSVLQVAMARDGAFVVLGCAAGQVVILKGDSLQETVALRHTKHDITRWVVGLPVSKLSPQTKPVECLVYDMRGGAFELKLVQQTHARNPNWYFMQHASSGRSSDDQPECRVQA